MNTTAVEQAKAALLEAKAAREAFRVAATKEGMSQFRVAWARFLMACSRIYSKLEQGSKSDPKSVAWFGRKKHDRRADALLKYLHHARDVDYHGIEHVTTVIPGKVTVFAQDRDDYKVTRGDGWFELVALKPITINEQSPYLTLVDVTDTRFRDTFKVPTEHLGNPIQPWPGPVADAAIAYLDGMITEASQLPQIG